MILQPGPGLFRTAGAPPVTGPGTGVLAPVFNTGNPGLIGSWDFDKLDLLTLFAGGGQSISQAAPADGTTYYMVPENNQAKMPTSVLRTDRYAARFDKATTQYLRCGSDLGLSGAAVTMVAIYEPVTVNDHAFLVSIGDNATSFGANKQYLSGELTEGWGFNRIDSAGSSAKARVGSAYGGAGSRHILVGSSEWLAAQPAYGWLDGVSLPRTGTANSPTGCNTTLLGAIDLAGAVTYPADGYLFRVLIYNSTIDASQEQDIVDWAAANYGTPV